MQRVVRSLIANEGYEVAFTKHDRPYFNARPIDPAAFDPNQSPLNPADNFEWTSRCAIIPIPLVATNLTPSQPVVLSDPYRNLLLVQNNSAGNTSGGDVLPFLMVGLDGPVLPPVPGTPAGQPNPFALALAPGVGVIFDTRVPTNAIYIQWGGFTNATASFVAGAICMYGRTLNQPPLPPIANAPPMRFYNVNTAREISPHAAMAAQLFPMGR